MKRQAMVCCSMLCCIHFCFLVIALSLAIVVVALVYHPISPRQRVTSATLNAGHIDKRDNGAGALNANLTVVAAICNPNTKITIMLRYYDQRHTQAVWPSPLQEAPRGSVLWVVDLVVSNVTMALEDVVAWQNATKGRGPVVLRLAVWFHAQLDIGLWFRCRYWVKQKCTLWLNPPPRGALRRSQC
uniref:Late embryogenesis abundant protein LEA-2 subgroup domain-containing protein n=1 Tax=Leersia perrieri TaxID=77586 RepID=A0A0D9V9A8_9ORYZ